jgi:rhodanese-related sulfurtransferase
MSNPTSRFQQLVEESKQKIRECDAKEIQAKLERGEPFHLVDVREESEWHQGHLPHAIHLGKGVIERDIEKMIPDLNAEIMLYCGGGSRSALAAENLQRMGYRHVFSMTGGFGGWKKAGLPIEKT